MVWICILLFSYRGEENALTKTSLQAEVGIWISEIELIHVINKNSGPENLGIYINKLNSCDGQFQKPI